MSVSTYLEVSTRRSGEAQIVSASGEIDLATKDILRTALFEAPSGADEIVLDLSEITFMDSTGLTLLFEAAERFSSGERRLRIITVPGQVRKIIDLCGVASFLNHDQLEAA